MKSLTNGLGPSIASLVWLGTVSCAPEETRILRPDLLADPQTIALDYSSPSYRFDGQGGSLLPTDGWAPPEAGSQPKDTPFFAWALKGTASMVFLSPPGAGYDFFARIKPFIWEHAPPQQMTVIVNDQEIATLTLSPGWQTYRSEVPEGALRPGLNELTFRFTNSKKPSDVTDSRDDRELSAAFSDVAMIPKTAREPWALLDLARVDEPRNIVEISARGGFSIPLPGRSRGQLQLGSVDSQCSDCEMIVEMFDPAGGEQTIWRGDLADAEGREFRFRTSDHWVGFLGLRLMPPEESSTRDDAKTLIQLRPESLRAAVPRRESNRTPPPVFIYMIDTLRADALTVYGAIKAKSPRISEFASRAVTYREAWAPSAWTLPSVSSLFTGLYPSRHGMGLADRKMPGATLPLMARILSEEGYHTLGVSQSFVASASFGLAEGFDRYLLSNQLNGWELRSAELRRFMLMLLSVTSTDKPPFVYLHSVDPHSPYLPRERYRRFLADTMGKLPERSYRPALFMHDGYGDDPYEVETMRALYQGEVMFADHQFGYFLDLLQQLSLLEGSMVVLLSDHGEEFGEHGAFDHGRTLHQEMLRVPLLIQFPDSQWAGTEFENRVSLLDVLPTVLHQAGVDSSEVELDGHPLQPDLAAKRATRPIIAETHTQPAEKLAAVNLQAMALAMTKCIHSEGPLDQLSRPVPKWRTYDLQSDPEEQQPLESDDPASQDCVSLLTAWLEARSSWEGTPVSAGDEVDEEALDALRALGYIQ